jgi:hypothetical protein
MMVATRRPTPLASPSELETRSLRPGRWSKQTSKLALPAASAHLRSFGRRCDQSLEVAHGEMCRNARVH